MDNNQINTTVESTSEAAANAAPATGDSTAANTSTHHHSSSHHHSSHHHSSHHSSHHHHRHHSSSHRHRKSHSRHSFLHKYFSRNESAAKKKNLQSMIKSYTVFGLLLLSIVIAFFPDGLIKRLIGGKPVSGMTFEQIFTYFNPSGATNTNFGPLLLTAVCAILLVMSIVQLTNHRSLIIKRMVPIVSVIALVIALMPLILDVGTLSITGIVIALLLAFVFWLSCKNPFERK